MARNTPTYTPKFSYFLALLLAILFLIADFRFQAFNSVRSAMKWPLFQSERFIIYIKDGFFDSIKYFQSKSQIIEENHQLKSKITSYELISVLNEDVSNVLNYEKDILNKRRVVSFDTDLYFCCGTHRLFIQSNELIKEDHYVVNPSGLIGQLFDINNSLAEIILLSDKDHKIPIMNEDLGLFCNAYGSGKPRLIFCDIQGMNLSIGNLIDQEVYSSGFGGIFPRGMIVGKIIQIEDKENDIQMLYINLVGDPLSSSIISMIQSS